MAAVCPVAEAVLFSFQLKDWKGYGKNGRTKSNVKTFSGKRGQTLNQVSFCIVDKCTKLSCGPSSGRAAAVRTDQRT